MFQGYVSIVLIIDIIVLLSNSHSHKSFPSLQKKKKKKKKKDLSREIVMFRVGFHTAFVEAGVLVLNLCDLDDVTKNLSKFDPDFQVFLFLCLSLFLSFSFSLSHSFSSTIRSK